MVIASGHEAHPLERIAKGERCTWFLAPLSALQSRKHTSHPHLASSPVGPQSRKRWIAGTLQPVGRLIVDDGARTALGKGKSLLPAGVKQVKGTFARGDTVSVVTLEGLEIARGLVAYDSGDAARIAGLKSADIEQTIGYRGRDEIIHRDDLVMTNGER